MQDRTNKVFKAIADPTRRDILHALVVASIALPITEISKNFDISRQGITKHIRVLEEADLVSIEKKGRETIILANTNPLKEIKNWLKFYEDFWDSKLKGLVNYLDNK